MNLSISPGKNNVGAYINDINLKSLDQNQATEIKKILNQFGVIFIKEQNLDPETYQNFAKTIGQPVVYPRLKGLDEKFPFINVIERKPDDKNLIQTSRCIVPADGYYEWKREDKNKIPYYFSKTDDEIMFFAAIHQNNQFCIITREATEKISTIHHREPLIINRSQINNYLNVKKDAMEILNSIKPPELKFHEISKDVNNPINNDPALIKPLN